MSSLTHTRLGGMEGVHMQPPYLSTQQTQLTPRKRKKLVCRRNNTAEERVDAGAVNTSQEGDIAGPSGGFADDGLL